EQLRNFGESACRLYLGAFSLRPQQQHLVEAADRFCSKNRNCRFIPRSCATCRRSSRKRSGEWVLRIICLPVRRCTRANSSFLNSRTPLVVLIERKLIIPLWGTISPYGNSIDLNIGIAAGCKGPNGTYATPAANGLLKAAAGRSKITQKAKHIEQIRLACRV